MRREFMKLQSLKRVFRLKFDRYPTLVSLDFTGGLASDRCPKMLTVKATHHTSDDREDWSSAMQ